MKVKKLCISTKRGSENCFIAKPSDDGTSIIIQSVMEGSDNEEDADFALYHNAVSFLEHEDYVYTTTKIGPMMYNIVGQKPYYGYFEEDNNVPDVFKEFYVECITPQNNTLRVHWKNYDKETGAFNSFIVTHQKSNDIERLVATVKVDTDDELNIGFSFGPKPFLK